MSNTKTRPKTDKPVEPVGSTQELAKLTVAQSFVNRVMRNLQAETGDLVSWTPYQQTLAQHLYIKIDKSLRELQSKGKNVRWDNVNMVQLALDAMHIVNLELDGLLKNHVDVIPYKNGALSASAGKPVYDLALRPGYQGHLLSHVRASVYPVHHVVTHLVFEGDTFEPTFSPAGDSYVYKASDPFRADEAVKGGFGFIVYDEPSLNKIVLVTARDLARSQKASKSRGTKTTDEETGEVSTSGNFWQDSYIEMCEKTVVHRTADAIGLDPRKLNKSVKWAIERAAEAAEAEMDERESTEANVVEGEFFDDNAGHGSTEAEAVEATPAQAESQEPF